MNLSTEIDKIIQTLNLCIEGRNYWMIRTSSGSYYDTFRDKGFVALEHREVPLSFLYELKNKYKKDDKLILKSLKQKILEDNLLGKNPDEQELRNLKRESSLIASQIFRFVYQIKKDDYVIIPSENSRFISFGKVKEGYLDNRAINSNFVLRREVNWLKQVKRGKLDPYLYRMFTAHQAIVDVNDYSEIIERSVKDFFILSDSAHLIIEIEREHEIPAVDLFGLGTEMLKLIDDFAVQYKLDISSNDFNVTINLNSPGKIDLKSKVKKTTVVAGFLLFLVGGGVTSKYFDIKTPGVPALIQAIDEYKTHSQERALKQEVFDKYKDSLRIKTPDDMIKLLKQVSDNKDIAK